MPKSSASSRWSRSAVAALALLLIACADDEPAERPRDGWDVSRLPKVDVLREERKEGGVIVRVTKEGTGEPLPRKAALDVRYTGYHLDGRDFDSGVYVVDLAPARPAVIRGWVVGLEAIRTGEKRRLLIPAPMAYGPTGTRDGRIRPDEPLVFDVERLDLVVETEDLTVGTGDEAVLRKTVTFHAKGTLPDETVVHSTFGKGPMTVRLIRDVRQGGTFEGLLRGIPGMREGGRRLIRVPPELLSDVKQFHRTEVPQDASIEYLIELLDVK